MATKKQLAALKKARAARKKSTGAKTRRAKKTSGKVSGVITKGKDLILKIRLG